MLVSGPSPPLLIISGFLSLRPRCYPANVPDHVPQWFGARVEIVPNVRHSAVPFHVVWPPDWVTLSVAVTTISTAFAVVVLDILTAGHSLASSLIVVYWRACVVAGVITFVQYTFACFLIACNNTNYMSITSGGSACPHSLSLLGVQDIEHGWRFCVPANPGFCSCIYNDLAVWKVSSCVCLWRSKLTCATS